jgi:hypothetical protein
MYLRVMSEVAAQAVRWANYHKSMVWEEVSSLLYDGPWINNRISAVYQTMDYQPSDQDWKDFYEVFHVTFVEAWKALNK